MTELPRTPCYLNGEYTVLADAKISVMDRGFIFGDGIYEVVPLYQGQPFRFEHHMQRLERSLREMRLPAPLSAIELRAIATKLVANYVEHIRISGPKDAQIPDLLLYLQITRGVALRDHAMTADPKPTVFAMLSPMKLPSAEQRAQGVACVTADDFRWQKAHIKSTSLLGAVFARQISFDAGAVETVMFRDHFLSEASASNVWVVKDGSLVGPPKDNLVLEGIRYGLMHELCAAAGVPFSLRRVTEAEVRDADELLLSSATKEVLAVTTLDGKLVGHGAAAGKPGPVYAKLYAGYQAAKQAAFQQGQ